MSNQVSVKLKPGFQKAFRGIFEGYRFQVGVLNESAHRIPKPKSAGLKTVAGGPARKAGVASRVKMSSIAAFAASATGINFLKRPFIGTPDVNLQRFVNEFFTGVLKNPKRLSEASRRRCENLLQAVIRNPILKRKYGPNRQKTANTKGFNRKFIDTGQLFNSIKAKVTRGRK